MTKLRKIYEPITSQQFIERLIFWRFQYDSKILVSGMICIRELACITNVLISCRLWLWKEWNGLDFLFHKSNFCGNKTSWHTCSLTRQKSQSVYCNELVQNGVFSFFMTLLWNIGFEIFKYRNTINFSRYQRRKDPR